MITPINDSSVEWGINIRGPQFKLSFDKALFTTEGTLVWLLVRFVNVADGIQVTTKVRDQRRSETLIFDGPLKGMAPYNEGSFTCNEWKYFINSLRWSSANQS